MSRNAETGFQIYQELYDKGVELVFLKEPHINTATYKKALSNNIELTGTKTDIILKAINEYLMDLAKEQIIIAFEQSERNRSLLPLSSLRKKFLTYISVQKKVSKPHGETASRSVANRVLLLQRKRA